MQRRQLKLSSYCISSGGKKQRASEIAMKPMAAAGIDKAPYPHDDESARP
jgi:hypothetical protein